MVTYSWLYSWWVESLSPVFDCVVEGRFSAAYARRHEKAPLALPRWALTESAGMILFRRFDFRRHKFCMIHLGQMLQVGSRTTA